MTSTPGDKSRRCRALVLGGTGALGRKVCENLTADGTRVVFTYKDNEQTARDIEKQTDAGRGLQVDLVSVSALERTVDQAATILGGIDAFIHCAALCVAPGEHVPADSNQHLDDIQEAGWDLILAVNAKSAFFGCRRVGRFLREAGGGNIVFIGSIDVVKPLPAPVHYAASKGALLGMTLALAKELGPDNIRVNMVTPGLMDGGKARTLPAQLREEYVKHCGLKRVGQLPEVANVVTWLAQHNTYVTGQSIVVDGAL